MDTKFVITRIKDIIVGCTIKDEKIFDIRCYEDESLIGNIYMAKVSNIVKNINAAFVDIAKGVSCYLPLEDYGLDKPISIGDEFIVQVAKDGIKTKKPTVTTNISVNGEFVIAKLNSVIGISSKIKGESVRKKLKDIAANTIYSMEDCNDFGVIYRTKSVDYTIEEEPIINSELLADDIKKSIEELKAIKEKAKYATLYSPISISDPAYVRDVKGFYGNIEVITDCLDIYDNLNSLVKDSVENVNISWHPADKITLSSLYNISMTIEKCLNKKAYLKSGGYLIIEPTEAMTVIDVNTGKAIKGTNKEQDFLKLNIEAAKEVARQIRLRNLSGIIIVDFINMQEETNNILLLEEQKKAVLSDYVGTNVIDMTKLGLVEITRKKVRKPLHEVF